MTAREYIYKLQEYKSLGGVKFLKEFDLEAGKAAPKKFWKEKLAWEFKKLKSQHRKNKTQKATIPVIEDLTLRKIKPVDNVPATQKYINAPYSVRVLRTQYAHLAKEQAAIHARLRFTPPTERFAACFRIIEIGQEHDKIWDEIREWEKTGVEPELQVEKGIVEMVIDKHNRYKTLLTYRTRYSKKLEGNIDDKSRDRYEGYLKNYEVEIAQIKKELNLKD